MNSIILGDANADNQTSLMDLILLRKHLVGTETLSSANQAAMDINVDGSISLIDLVKLRRILVGMD